MDRVDVQRLQRADEPSAVVTLARAFHDDPLFNFFTPNLIDQAHSLLDYMGARVADARPFDEIWIAQVRGKVAGTAVWLPAGAYPRGFRRDMLMHLRSLTAARHAARRAVPALRLMRRLSEVHRALDDVPHQYLAMLGVDPLLQRGGIGSALLGVMLERCDAEGLPGYLETHEENLAFYNRHDFRVVDVVTIEGCPKMWAMQRGA